MISSAPSLTAPFAQSDTRPWMLDVLGVAGLMYLGALARVPLPFTPTPITLQTLVALTAPFLIGRNRAFLGIALYLALGLTSGGLFFSAMSGVTWGYLLGFLLTPLVVSWFPRTPAGVVSAMGAATLLILGLGSLWLGWLLGCTPREALLLGAVPFLVGDFIKAGIACKIVSVYAGETR